MGLMAIMPGAQPAFDDLRIPPKTKTDQFQWFRAELSVVETCKNGQ